MSRSDGSKTSLALGASVVILAFACLAVMRALVKAAEGVSAGTLVFYSWFAPSYPGEF